MSCQCGQFGVFLRCGAAVAASLLIGTTVAGGELDDSLRVLLSQQGVTPLAALSPPDTAQVELGQLLFFDKELSGNRDIACASCHHPQLMTGDARSLPVGTAGLGLGPARTLGPGREIVPRNSPEIFHRGQDQWTSMFWDSRVSGQDGSFQTPAQSKLPAGLDSVLAAQAMFPVTSRTEMRGGLGDRDINGGVNELCEFDDSDLTAMWQSLTSRLLAIPEYQQRFAEVYPDVPQDQLGFQHAANAIAAFEANAFAQADSAWDRYLNGDQQALSEAAKRGAHLFFGEANCATCHSGNLLTDQKHHDIGIPQLGPGKVPATSLDPGRALVTGQAADEFAFRTPPLRNVAVTGPWMHNGAYTNLEDAVRHYKDPESALHNYDASQLAELLQGTVKTDEATIMAILNNLDSQIVNGTQLSTDQINDLMAFVFALTSPSLDLLPDLVPETVPSGLEVDALAASSLALQYDVMTGELRVGGSPDDSLSGLFLRLKDGPEGSDFEFTLGQAAWTEQDQITLANELRAQSFVEYRTGKPFLLHGRDTVGHLLPAGLSQGELDEYLAVVFMREDSTVLWNAGVVAVPEPRSLAAITLVVVGLISQYRRTNRRTNCRTNRDSPRPPDQLLAGLPDQMAQFGNDQRLHRQPHASR